MTLEREYMPASFPSDMSYQKRVYCATSYQCFFMIFSIMFFLIKSKCAAEYYSEIRESVSITTEQRRISTLYN